MDILGVFQGLFMRLPGKGGRGGKFDRGAESPYDEKVGLEQCCALRRLEPMRLSDGLVKRTLVPPRSMVGQLPLEQPIGVRIPGGQPITHFPLPS